MGIIGTGRPYLASAQMASGISRRGKTEQARRSSCDDGYTTTDSAGAKHGHVDWTWVDPLARGLLTTYFQPDELTIFLMYGVQTYNWKNLGASHTVGGWHLSDPGPLGTMTYIVSNLTDGGDVATLSHELGEWLDDPFANNKVPAWTGESITGCSSTLEVGDPVNGVSFTKNLSGMTYRPQDLVFLSWFARRSPSTSINQWYTFRNTLTSPQPVCQRRGEESAQPRMA